ncbi:MAG: SUMF1/EgtB/PvdO family nonheme iron enzyme, partial [Thermoguttaceae bacterium]|nr:SUMF1/EgtB/PvdO family nonheme iron enzyme [Thermoguttaceae bacterium]MBQ9128923.1 SUMF1/EgtB/PvdO family nonheme iron enzyme [Thermoguttaceae bacterium]
GNVSEWCSDWFAPYDAKPQTDPRGPSKGSYRVLRGGCRVSVAEGCRSAARNSDAPKNRGYDNGLRLVLSANASSSRSVVASAKILTLCLGSILLFCLVCAKRLRQCFDFSRLSSDGKTGERL